MDEAKLASMQEDLAMQIKSWQSNMSKKEGIMRLQYGWQRKVEEGWMSSLQI